MSDLTYLDLLIFFGSLVLIMYLGLRYGGGDKNSEDYFLAGNQTRWWGVAGSIFGSNVSANHIVGMLGVGYSIGFAQSHFEIGAVVGLLLLCYVFLPIYKKLQITTLGEYLARRYDERSRCLYALIMIFIIVFVMMVPGFYIGSRSLNILISGDYQHVDKWHYIQGIWMMALITGSYTIFGGLRAVIYTDVFQSILLLVGTLIVAWITFSQPEIGSWSNLMEIDRQERDLMHLYLPSDHPDLPWSGVLSGLFMLHIYYWGANQFIVQRALSAKNMNEARFGIILAGFFKLLIPFISIGTGIAAYYLFQKRGLNVDQDAAFTTLITVFVKPLGYGLVGLVAAGLIGAILSSLDSMMNSAATLLTFDVYKRYVNLEASDQKMIKMGKLCMIFLIILAACIASLAMDPNSDSSFFLEIARHQANLISGLVAVFVLGMLWSRATAQGAFAAILTGIFVSYTLPYFYQVFLKDDLGLEQVLGGQLNFLHTVLISGIVSALVHVLFSLLSTNPQDHQDLTWLGLEGHSKTKLMKMVYACLGMACFLVCLAILMKLEFLIPFWCGILAGSGIFSLFVWNFYSSLPKETKDPSLMFKDDRFYAGLLAGSAAFMLYFYQ